MQWRKIIGLALSGIAMVLLGWMLVGEREPVYRDRTLSEWMVKRQTALTMADMEEADAALRAIGTRGVPWMVRWLRCDEPPWWKAGLYAAAERLPPGLVHLKNSALIPAQWHRAEAASVMLYSLGPGATNAIPELLRIVNARNTKEVRARALCAIECLGADALPCLLGAIADSNQSNRVELVHIIGNSRGDARAAVPVLIQCLQQRNAALAAEATKVLGVLKLNPGVVVPELIRGLTHRDSRVRANSAEALRQFGKAAKGAVPGLVAQLRDVDITARTAARAALLTIAPEALEKDGRRAEKGGTREDSVE